MSTEIDAETRRRLASGDVKGEPLEAEEQHPEGVVAKKPNGQRVFYDQTFIQAMKLRSRGKD